MRVEVLNTGTELMLGNVVNTHLAFMAQSLFPLGLRIERQVTVPDGEAIREALVETFGTAEIVLVTGGLGPTTDDLTRDIACELLGLKMEFDEEIWRAIQERFNRRGIPWTERVKLQAMRPPEAVVLFNHNGTAPGLYFPPQVRGGRNTPHLFLLPGPPRELKPMFQDGVVPIIARLVPERAATEMRTFRVVGMGESLVEDKVGADLLRLGLEVGYCARPGEVDLRLIGGEEALRSAEALVNERLGASIFTADTRSLEEVVIDALSKRGQTIAIAESCTGGLLANRLTNVPGASKVFLGGYVTYANAVKTAALGVDPGLIEKHGAVSRAVATAMAEGALKAASARFALSTTGIAGPDGGSAEKPVGTVFISLAETGKPTVVRKHRFPTDRETFKFLVAQTAFDVLLRRINDREIPGDASFSEGDGGCSGAT